MASSNTSGTKTTAWKTCGGCATRYDADGWASLERCGELNADQVKASVIGWPDTAIIDLRRCGKCHMVLARRL